MDQALIRAAVDRAGRDEPVTGTRPVGGGCISEAWWVELEEGSPLFVKCGSGASGEMFRCEAEGLAALAAAGSLRVPRDARIGTAGSVQFIVMEGIVTGAPGPSFFTDFGRRFAALHRTATGEAYGFAHDNYIGATPQPNGWMESWTEFFRLRRLGYQLDLARSRGLVDATLSRLGDRLLDRLGEWLGEPDEPPCLLHGDLWGGNYMADSAGAPVLVDPACYYGRREADLAMTQLFGGFAPEFYAAYEEAWPLAAGSAQRLEIYKLYHLLNHLNLFGGAYHGQCVGVLKRLV